MVVVAGPDTGHGDGVDLGIGVDAGVGIAMGPAAKTDHAAYLRIFTGC